MNTPLKSMIRHALTALGTILTLIGLNDAIPVIDFLQNSLDYVWEAAVILIGFVTTLIGFLKDSNRFETPTETK